MMFLVKKLIVDGYSLNVCKWAVIYDWAKYSDVMSNDSEQAKERKNLFSGPLLRDSRNEL